MRKIRRKNQNRYYKGDWNIICDRSGFKAKASDCRMTWEGYFVLKDEWEPRHPQDYVRGVPDPQFVPITRPEARDVFIEVGDVTREDL